VASTILSRFCKAAKKAMALQLRRLARPAQFMLENEIAVTISPSRLRLGRKIPNMR